MVNGYAKKGRGEEVDLTTFDIIKLASSFIVASNFVKMPLT